MDEDTITTTVGKDTVRTNVGKDTATTIPSFNPSGNKDVQAVKDKAEELLNLIKTTVPVGRAQSLALTNVEQGAMWAVKAFFV